MPPNTQRTQTTTAHATSWTLCAALVLAICACSDDPGGGDGGFAFDVADTAVVQDVGDTPDIAAIDAEPDTAPADDTLGDVAQDSGGPEDVGAPDAGCAANGCDEGDNSGEGASPRVCLDDGTCCQPACEGLCGGAPDGCGGTCDAECNGVCDQPVATPVHLHRVYSAKPLSNVPVGAGCVAPLGVGPADGSAVTDAANDGFEQGNTVALAWALDASGLAQAASAGLHAAYAGGSGCATGQEGCKLQLWKQGYNPHGLPGATCPARATLKRDPAWDLPTFAQDPDSVVPSFVPFFLFAGPVEQTAPWVRVRSLRVQPATSTANPGIFCGVVRADDLEAAIAKLDEQQKQDPSVTALVLWMNEAGHEPTVDTDGDQLEDGWPFAFSQGIAKAGLSVVLP
jgi:hypothetical protein